MAKHSETIFSSQREKLKDLFNRTDNKITIILTLVGALLAGVLVANNHPIIAVVVFMLCSVGSVFTRILFYDPSHYDAAGRRNVSHDYDLGSANSPNDPDDKEFKSTFSCGTYESNLANYIGSVYGTNPYTDPDVMLSVIRTGAMNGNAIYFGAPGSGKTASLIIPMIFQIIRRRESAIVTDPKGELYAKTAIMAKKHGIKVKLICFSPDLMSHSDSCNYTQTLGNDDIKILDFVNTLMENTSEGKLDFWDKSEANLMQAGLLDKCNDDSIDEEEKTLGAFYRWLVENSAEDLKAHFENLTWASPAKGPAYIYSNSSDKVQEDTRGSLGVRINTLNNPILRKITGVEDIDYIAPGYEPCIYYVVSDDTSSTLNFYQSIFFTLMCKELKNYADHGVDPSKNKVRGSLPVKVNFIMDEFANLGRIPNIEKYLATFRGRNMDFTLILQNIGQLQTAYPENMWESIIDCCSVMVCLKTNSLATAKYFSERTGVQNIIVKSKSYNHNELNPAEKHIRYHVSESVTARSSMTVDEVCRLNDDEMLVIVSGHNGFILNKPYYFYHPMYKEIVETNVLWHMPKWIKEVIAKDDEDELAMLKIDKEEWANIYGKEEELVERVNIITDFTGIEH